MMKEVHEYLKEKDVNRIYCHAQMTAKPFYDRLGYQVKGETFDEGGIEHVLMYKDLQIKKHLGDRGVFMVLI